MLQPLLPNRPAFIICLFLLISNTTIASGQDSLKLTRKKNKGDFIINTRLHSTAHFPFTGSFINRHLNFDINLFYERNRIGAFLFKAQDLEDMHGIVNYLQPGIFKRFPVGKKLTFTLFGGYLFNQTARFSDKDSDVWGALNTSWTINDHFKVENTALFFNLTKPELNAQLANRTVISALVKDFKFDLYFWHNVVFETKFQFTSAALAINFPKIHLSEKIKIQNSFMYQSYISENKPSWAMRNGFLFTIAVPIQLSTAG
jgi:hypothetical protein